MGTAEDLYSKVDVSQPFSSISASWARAGFNVWLLQ